MPCIAWRLGYTGDCEEGGSTERQAFLVIIPEIVEKDIVLILLTDRLCDVRCIEAITTIQA